MGKQEPTNWNTTVVRCIETGEKFDNVFKAAEAIDVKYYSVQHSVERHSMVGDGYHFVKDVEEDYETGVKDLPGERWYDIPGWEGLYQFSNKFRVKSIQRKAKAKGGHLRAVPDVILADTGQYKFYSDGEQYFFTTQRLKLLCPQALERKKLFKFLD